MTGKDNEYLLAETRQTIGEYLMEKGNKKCMHIVKKKLVTLSSTCTATSCHFGLFFFLCVCVHIDGSIS